MYCRLSPLQCDLAGILLALFVAFPVPAMADITKQTMTIDGRERVYYVYDPGTTNQAPLLVLLHGSYQDGLYMIRLWQEVADRDDIVLVAPDALHRDGWRPLVDGPSYIMSVIGAVTARRSIDPRRIYLFGQSGGAEYALSLGVLESNVFAAIAIHAGAWRSISEYNLASAPGRRVPMKIIIGDLDEFFPLSLARKTEAALRQAGFPIEVTIVAGQHHWFDNRTAPEIEAAAWTFLKAHTMND